MSHTFTVGQRVKFTTPGRHPRDHHGKVEKVESAFLTVKCDDGFSRKTRPGAAHAA